MRRRLAVLIVVASVILGGMVSISSPFGVGLVVVRRPMVLLQDAAERVVRALLGRRGTSGPDQTGASHPSVASVAADAGPAGPTIESPGGATARLTQERRGTRRAEHDGHEAADQRHGQTQPEDDSSSAGYTGALRIAGRDLSDANAAAQEGTAAPHTLPNGQHSGGAAAPPSNSSANDGSANVNSPAVGQSGSEGRNSDRPEQRNEPGQGGEHSGRSDRDDDHHHGDHRDGNHRDRDDRDRDKDDKGHK